MRLKYLLIASLFFWITSPVLANSNNKVGIHLLQPSEINLAANLVNSHGGDWGYVTIPIQPTDRNRPKWIHFMVQAKQLHLIPILRITTIPQGGTWTQAQATDLVDFANFLNQLPWPTKSRYIVIFNEVNRAQEWGGRVDPQTYAKILRNAYIIFKQRSSDFFILPAGLDNALPDSNSSMSSKTYLRAMVKFDPQIWSYIDGWTSHAYPNPNFAASPYKTGWQSITSYRQELAFIKKSLPVFITETGWDQTKIKNPYFYYKKAWQIWLKDKRVQAVTPFVLQGSGGVFAGFSFLDSNGQPTPAWKATFDLPKTKGQPLLAKTSISSKNQTSTFSSSPHLPIYHSTLKLLLKLENFFRQLFNLPLKKELRLGQETILVEVAQTPKQIQQGLSHRAHLDADSGMLFILPKKHQARFWMKDMNFPLDLVWLDQNHIVGFDLNLPPEGSQPQHIYSSPKAVDMVLELPAGYVKYHQLKIGDTIKLL